MEEQQRKWEPVDKADKRNQEKMQKKNQKKMKQKMGKQKEEESD